MQPLPFPLIDIRKQKFICLSAHKKLIMKTAKKNGFLLDSTDKTFTKREKHLDKNYKSLIYFMSYQTITLRKQYD